MFFFCLNIFGQKTDVISKQQETILQLQKENNDLQKQLDKMEKEIEVYREDVRSCTSEMNDNMSLWLTMLGNKLTLFSLIITVITAFLGGVVPYFINKRNKEEQDKRFSEIKEDLDKQFETLTKQAKDDLCKQIDEATEKTKTDLNSQISEAKKQAEIAKKQAREAKVQALSAKACLILLQAYDEKNLNTAIKLLNKCIKISPKSYAAYCNRGIAKAKLPEFGPQAAIKDFDKAIKININCSKAYRNLAICYRKLAAKETDATKKNEYRQKAKENDDKAQKIENLNKS